MQSFCPNPSTPPSFNAAPAPRSPRRLHFVAWVHDDFVAEREAAEQFGFAAVALPHVHGREPGAAVAARLAKEGICCGGGDFYAVRCLKAQGIDPGHGVLRLSFVHYTAKAEIDRLTEALDRAL